MIRVERLRKERQWCNQQIKKAKRRSVALCRVTIRYDRRALWRLAEAWQAHGWVSEKTSLKDVRFAILRRMAKLDGYGRNDTLGYYRRHGSAWWKWLEWSGWVDMSWRYD